MKKNNILLINIILFHTEKLKLSFKCGRIFLKSYFSFTLRNIINNHHNIVYTKFQITFILIDFKKLFGRK